MQPVPAPILIKRIPRVIPLIMPAQLRINFQIPVLIQINETNPMPLISRPRKVRQRRHIHKRPIPLIPKYPVRLQS